MAKGERAYLPVVELMQRHGLRYLQRRDFAVIRAFLRAVRTGDHDLPYSRWKDALGLPTEQEMETIDPPAEACRARKQRRPSREKPKNNPKKLEATPTASAVSQQPCARQMWVTPTVWERIDWGVSTFQEPGGEGPAWEAVETRTTVDAHTWEVIAIEKGYEITDKTKSLPGPTPRDVKTIFVTYEPDKVAPPTVDETPAVGSSDHVDDEDEDRQRDEMFDEDDVWLFCPPL